MAEKDDLQNLEADLGLLQHRCLRGLSSGLPDTMPAPGIALERLRLSNDAINYPSPISILCILLTVSAPPDIKESVGRPCRVTSFTPHTYI